MPRQASGSPSKPRQASVEIEVWRLTLSINSVLVREKESMDDFMIVPNVYLYFVYLGLKG